MNTPSRADLLASLSSTVCPACGQAKKKRRQTICRDCWRKLDRKAGMGLYLPLGQGYEESVAHALAVLGATTFHLPPDDDLAETQLLPDAQARNLVLGAFSFETSLIYPDLKKRLGLPVEQLRRMLQQLMDDHEIVSDPLRDPHCTIPAFRRIDPFAQPDAPLPPVPSTVEVRSN